MSEARPGTANDEAKGNLPRHAFEERLAEIKASEDHKIPPNLDISLAATRVIAVAEPLRILRPQMALLHDFNLERFDKLHSYALATLHADTAVTMTNNEGPPVQALVKQAKAARAILRMDAALLAQRKLIPAYPGDQFAHLRGHRSVATELMALAYFLNKYGSQIEGRSALQQTDVHAAQLLAEQLIDRLAARQRRPATFIEAQSLRRRVFWLMANAYDDARRAAIYLRWHHKDVARWVPSLYRGKGGRGRRGAVNGGANPETESSASSVVLPVAATNGSSATLHDATTRTDVHRAPLSL